MIAIDIERCTGCGVCVEVCPTGAVFLVEGKAAVGGALCRDCEACVAACPTGAIVPYAQEEAVAEATYLPALRPEPEVIQVNAASALTPRRIRLLPALGAALAWAGRELLPSLVDLLDRRATTLQAGGAARNRQASTPVEGSGRQHRQRRRGGSK